MPPRAFDARQGSFVTSLALPALSSQGSTLLQKRRGIPKLGRQEITAKGDGCGIQEVNNVTMVVGTPS